MSALIDYHCMVKTKASIDQFTDGLGWALQLIKKYPRLSEPLFVPQKNELTSGKYSY